MRALWAVVLLASASTVGAQTPAEWVVRMLEATQATSHHGELVHMMQGGKRGQSMRIVRRVGPDGYLERLLTLDGTPSEVLRDGSSVTCILPEGRESLAGQRVPRNPFPVSQWDFSEQVNDSYRISDLGEGRVAGRSCRVIGIEPRDEARYGYRLWVDSETGLLLQSETLDHEGDAIERVAFTRVAIAVAIDDSQLAATLDGERLHWRIAPRGRTETTLTLVIDGLPQGFHFRRERRRDDGVVQHVYSDGLATISVFVAPGRREGGLEGHSHMGAHSAYGLYVDDHHVTVVGEVPAQTVERIGTTLRIGR